MKKIIFYIIVITFAISINSKCFPEQIYLKDGTQLEGRIIKQSENLIALETKFGRIVLERDVIKKIIFKTRRGRVEFGQKWNSIGLMMGYKIFTSTGMYDFYATTFQTGASYTAFISDRSIAELSIGYSNKKSKIINNIRFINVPLSLNYKHILFQYHKQYPFFCVGTSYNWVWIKAKSPFANINLEKDYKKFIQKDSGFGLITGIGTYLYLQPFLFKWEFKYSHTFIGDNRKGRLGNIGGLNFNFSVQYNF